MGFNPKPVADFIGNGLIFPIKLTNGRGTIYSGFDLLRSSIRNILAFKYGTKFFSGEFGSRLNELMEEPNDEVLKNLIETFVFQAITRWEKRVSTVSSSIVRVDSATVQVQITYQIKNSQSVDNFIYPFYRQIIN